MIHSNGTMVISGVLYEDAGMYVCQAKNVLGIAKSTMLLIVHGTTFEFLDLGKRQYKEGCDLDP